MAATTGIGWTDGTVNFFIGCTKVGPGCEGCYAEVFAERKFNIKFGPGERRHKTKAGYTNPLRWQRMHEKHAMSGAEGPAMMKDGGVMVPVPVWVFCNSLSDFFDNEIDPEWRAEAWKIIRACPSLRWQIVTKRLGNVPKMLPADWHDGRHYRHVGIIGTMVNQEEYDRDISKLASLHNLGVNWTGISMEPQIGPINMHVVTDWVITGGESTQGNHRARPYDIEWTRSLIKQCATAGAPCFVKQLGDHPILEGGRATKFGVSGDDISKWPADIRVQQMPRIYDRDIDLRQPSLFNGG